jgi:hypothetical protein
LSFSCIWSPLARDHTISAARKSLRSAIDRDNKGGKKSALDLRMSYQKALTEFGYRGGLKEWEEVLTTKLCGAE